jgi:mgtE-like transporter
LRGGTAFIGLIGVFLIIISIAGFLGYKNKTDKFFIQNLKEGTLIVVLSSIFGGVNGIFLSGLSSKLSKNPGIIILYPALTNALGNIGSIIGSRTTTRMALGYTRSFKEELKNAGIFIILVEIPAAFMHIVFAGISFILAGSQSLGGGLPFLLSIALMTNLFSFLIISVFSLYSAYLAFQQGLNPDNVVIPAITSISDTTATISVLPSIFLAKLLGF